MLSGLVSLRLLSCSCSSALGPFPFLQGRAPACPVAALDATKTRPLSHVPPRRHASNAVLARVLQIMVSAETSCWVVLLGWNNLADGARGKVYLAVDRGFLPRQSPSSREIFAQGCSDLRLLQSWCVQSPGLPGSSAASTEACEANRSSAQTPGVRPQVVRPRRCEMPTYGPRSRCVRPAL